MRALSLTGGVEVEAGELDPARPTESMLDLVRRHGLVAVRGLDLTEAQYAGLTAEFGEPVLPPFLTEHLPGTGVTRLENTMSPRQFAAGQHTVYASGWHCDWTFLESPPTLSLLYCQEAPTAGGDTLFSDARAALEQISPVLREFLAGRTAVHSSDRSFSPVTGYDERSTVGAQFSGARPQYTARHPVIRPSPISGDPCLFVSPAHTAGIEGVFGRESDVLLGLIYDAMFWDEHLFRLSWEPATLAVWDNARFLHRALNQGVVGTRRLLRSNVRARL